MRPVNTKRKRSDIFRLLAACFYEPEKEIFLEDRLCEKLSGLLTEFSHEASDAARQMLDGLRNSNKEELQIAHAALFLGPFELQAPPYGSLYLENDNRIMGDTTLAVKEMYQNAGLDVDVHEPPDHIAIELEFVSYLCSLEADAAEENNVSLQEKLTVDRKNFFTKFLANWIPDFCNRIHNNTGNSFYQNLAECLKIFTATELSAMTHTNIINSVKKRDHFSK